jgi:hypothetical protein
MPRAVLAVVGRMTFSGGAGKTGTNAVGARPPKDSSECKGGQKGGDIRSGGARPDIVPVAPPVVAFPLMFPTSSMVIDTGGRKLYYILPHKKADAHPIRPRSLLRR